VKLVDFGFCKPVPYMNAKKEIQYRTFTLCGKYCTLMPLLISSHLIFHHATILILAGTPDYMAPEIVLTQGHDKSADYWAFGILLFELLCGYTPFTANNQKRMFEKIVASQKSLQFPPKFDSHAKSLIRRLLHPNASLRIGILQNGANDVKEHAFFSTQRVDFVKLYKKEITPPFVSVEKIYSSNSSIPPLIVHDELRAEQTEAYDIHFEGLCNSHHVVKPDEDEEEDEEDMRRKMMMAKAAASAKKGGGGGRKGRLS
jgi:serine/threonine protein kinase